MKSNCVSLLLIFVFYFPSMCVSGNEPPTKPQQLILTITVNSDDSPVIGAIVFVHNTQGYDNSIPTNENGIAKFENIPQGVYIYQVTASGYITAGADALVIGDGDTAKVEVVVPLTKEVASAQEETSHSDEILQSESE